MDISILKPKNSSELSKIFDKGTDIIMENFDNDQFLESVKNYNYYTMCGLVEAKKTIEEIISTVSHPITNKAC